MSNSQKFNNARYIKVFLDDTDPKNPKVKTVFSKKPFSPEQFTHIFMGILESYTASLLESNSNEAIYEHFNNVFGIFLSKLIPQDKIYEKDPSHKEFKAIVDNTLAKPNDEENKKATDDNRFAAYLLSRDILTNEVGLTPESADLILNRKLGLLKVNTEEGGETTTVSE
jgi:hypothetical protein